MKTSRRKFIEQAFKASAVITSVATPSILQAANTISRSSARPAAQPATTAAALQFAQVPLPYAYAALEPNIDATTMDIHYNKHHATYIKNVNEEIATAKITYTTEKDFFANATKLTPKARNNGGGAWNHNFFWQVMKPNAGGTPTGKVADAINGGFGSFDKFKEQFAQAATGRFGSGWAWLVKDNAGKLKIGSTANQDNPLMDSSDFKGTPLLALDVWEHAYYLKYQNKRADYITNWWNVVNWEQVAKNL